MHRNAYQWNLVRLTCSLSTAKTALWNYQSHLHSHTKVISHFLGKVICVLLLASDLHLLTLSHMSLWKYSSKQSVEHTKVFELNMHEDHTSCSGCLGVNDFLLSHYHKLWFIAIVARLHHYMITQSSGI